MCRGTKRGLYTKDKINVTIDKEVMSHIESVRGTIPVSTYINSILRTSIYGEPVEC